MCHFDEVWHYISSKVCPPGMADRVRIELPFAVFGTPLFHTWLGTKVDDVTTCSDASQTGGAIAIARELSPQGKGFMTSQERQNLPMEVPILVVSLFNGIGGAARRYDVAGVRVRAMLACDMAWDHLLGRRERSPKRNFVSFRTCGGPRRDPCVGRISLC